MWRNQGIPNLYLDWGLAQILTAIVGHSSSFCIARPPVIDNLHPNNLGFINIQCPHCKALHWIEERVSSSKIDQPEFQMCCAQGKVKLAPLRIPPAPLYNLYTGESNEANSNNGSLLSFQSL